MKASQFLLRALLVLAGVVILDFACRPAMDALRKFSLRTNPDNFEMTSYYGVEMASEDMLILGASTTTHHYIPSLFEDSLQMSVRNLGKDGAFLYCQICQLSLILERYTPKVILWDIHDDCLSHNLDWGDFMEISDYFPYQLNDISRSVVKEMGRFQPVSMQSWLYRYNSKLPEYLFSFVSGRNSQKGYVPLPADQGYAIDVSETKAAENLNQKKVELLEEVLALCKEKGCRVILATSPRLADDGVQQTEQYRVLCSITERMDIPYFNHHTDPRFFNETALFRDTDHLNEKGAMLYTGHIIEDLNQVLSNHDR